MVSSCVRGVNAMPQTPQANVDAVPNRHTYLPFTDTDDGSSKALAEIKETVAMPPILRTLFKPIHARNVTEYTHHSQIKMYVKT
jgi:hypothetical protein